MAGTTQKRTILFAEDDDDDRFVYGMAFDELEASDRFELKFANDGADLLAKLEQDDALPALIFLDMNMPMMDGKTCLSILRKTHSRSELPVIMLSTGTAPKDVDDTYLLKANLYQEKPRHYKSVVSMLENYVRKIDGPWPELPRSEFLVKA